MPWIILQIEERTIGWIRTEVSFGLRWVGIPIAPIGLVLRRVGDPESIRLEVNLVRDWQPRYVLGEKNHSPCVSRSSSLVFPRTRQVLSGPGGPAGSGLADAPSARNVPPLTVGGIGGFGSRNPRKTGPADLAEPIESQGRIRVLPGEDLLPPAA